MKDRYADYDPFAWFYNRYWGSTFADRFLAVIEQLLLSHLPQGARVLDLCCGTGQLARVLADQGFRVTGLDASEAMLAIARENAPEVEFILGDASRFMLPASFHGVLSTFDSLNHLLTPEELTAAFHNVYAALLDGGRFLFDLNMEAGYRARWRGSAAMVEEDNVCAVRAAFDPERKIGRNEITMFRLEGERWRRWDVTLTQRCYTGEEVRGALVQAGFGEIAEREAERDLGVTGNVGRSFFLARKPSRH
ncbi:MAG TPA: class I SAM-dependent methyltransferase [bacterium]|jgi:SAM-dependent methyltransferase|nr:class I SAM-dependent methyltransferase [bacterium]